MASTVSHPLPSAQAQAISGFTGYEDAATYAGQYCVQAANTLTALPNAATAVRMERMRQGLNGPARRRQPPEGERSAP
jgi:hypothetical protein